MLFKAFIIIATFLIYDELTDILKVLEDILKHFKKPKINF